MNSKMLVEINDGIVVPICELNDSEIKAIRVALHHQWYRTVDDNAKATTCSQEMADTTYKMLQLFEKLNELN